MTAARADTAASSWSNEPCPNPSVHDANKQQKMSGAAGKAALLVTNSSKKSGAKPDPTRDSVLSPDGRLSSSNAATSLKYANPRDLPSYPSSGLDASNTAASKAAMQAKDYKMKELWYPESSATGSRAATLAHRDGGKLDLWMPSASAEGNSAANLALRNKGLSPQLDRGYTQDGKSKALLAATQSMNLGRNRAGSAPSPAPPAYPDSNNAVKNALNAATVSHRGKNSRDSNSIDSPAMQAARVQNIGPNVNPEMWTDHPPVQIEEDEKKRQAALRASSISMAKQMMDLQNRRPSDTSGTEGALRAHGTQRSSTNSNADMKAEAMKYVHLQDAAQKLAQERLANAEKKHEHERYRQYWGYDTQPQRSRLTLRGRNRGRAQSNVDETDKDDEATARRIRTQMSALSTGVGEVDKKKQASDRQNVMAAAEKLVQSRMNTLNEKVFADTGNISPAMKKEWEAKARERAQANSDDRQKNYGKTSIGGGKFMDKSEIEAIALARLQPTLDEINDTAQKKRAKDEEIRLQKEEEERQKQRLKEKIAKEKAEQKKKRGE